MLPELLERPRAVTPRSGMLAEVCAGLARSPKSLPSKYFYDARGSALFEHICATPEYYLTRVELAIMQQSADAIAAALGPGVRLVEYGSGYGIKTRLLLAALENPAIYVPVEISASALGLSCADLQQDFPSLDIQPLQADFSGPVQLPRTRVTPQRTAVWLAGSTLGNFNEPAAIALLKQMRTTAGREGLVLLGLDLKKDPTLLHAAYNDSAGVTAAFTLNLLARLNRELQADFDLGQYIHRARYNALAGCIETDIVSRVAQRVHIGGTCFCFAADEPMRVEVSCKYDAADIERLAEAAGLLLSQQWTDDQMQFAVVLLRPAH